MEGQASEDLEFTQQLQREKQDPDSDASDIDEPDDGFATEVIPPQPDDPRLPRDMAVGQALEDLDETIRIEESKQDQDD
jgi:hypothetical protein